MLYYYCCNRYGRLAQLVEYLPYKQRVTGSSPVSPTISIAFYMREWLSGRALPCQGKCREFESRFPLHFFLQKRRMFGVIRYHSQAVRPRSATPLCPSSNLGGTSKKFDKFRLVEFFYPLRKQWYIITTQSWISSPKVYIIRRRLYLLSQ